MSNFRHLKSMTRQSCLTDLSNAEWKFIEPHLPLAQGEGRPRKHPMREILNAIFYLLRAGCAWRLLPHDFPKWKTVYHYFRVWRINGIWERINKLLRQELRLKQGREAEPAVPE